MGQDGIEPENFHRLMRQRIPRHGIPGIIALGPLVPVLLSFGKDAAPANPGNIGENSVPTSSTRWKILQQAVVYRLVRKLVTKSVMLSRKRQAKKNFRKLGKPKRRGIRTSCSHACEIQGNSSLNLDQESMCFSLSWAKESLCDWIKSVKRQLGWFEQDTTAEMILICLRRISVCRFLLDG